MKLCEPPPRTYLETNVYAEIGAKLKRLFEISVVCLRPLPFYNGGPNSIS
jgi:hypothetical protein